MNEPERSFTYTLRPGEYRVDGDPPATPAPRRTRRRVGLPLLLFAVTCLSTWAVGGPAFSATLMTILLCHELGHFLQAERYRVPASWPYFLPMPISPIGTMGAVILMRPGIGDRRALFDIAVTGPLAGLFPALAASWIGLRWSEVTALPTDGSTISLGEPLIFRAMSRLAFGPLPDGQDILLHPVAFAGWVGLFVTALNLLPIGQLDGGHVLYALLRRRAHPVAQGLLLGAALAVVAFGYWGWSLLLALLFWMGAKHPPTADDTVPLGRSRRILGWTCFAILVVGFTPEPFRLQPPVETPAPPSSSTEELASREGWAPIGPEGSRDGDRHRPGLGPESPIRRIRPGTWIRETSRHDASSMPGCPVRCRPISATT